MRFCRRFCAGEKKILLPYTHRTTPQTRQPPLDLRTLTQAHITPHLRRPDSAPISDDTSNDTLPDSPPKTNPQNLRTLIPILEVRTPIATKAIWGKTCQKHCRKRCLESPVSQSCAALRISCGIMAPLFLSETPPPRPCDLLSKGSWPWDHLEFSQPPSNGVPI